MNSNPVAKKRLALAIEEAVAAIQERKQGIAARSIANEIVRSHEELLDPGGVYRIVRRYLRLYPQSFAQPVSKSHVAVKPQNRRWNQDDMFPQTMSLDLVYGGDTPKTKRLHMLKTHNNRPECRCGKRAHYLALRTGDHWCKLHLPDEDQRRLQLDWQMNFVVLPIAQHLDRLPHP